MHTYTNVTTIVNQNDILLLYIFFKCVSDVFKIFVTLERVADCDI